MATVTLPSSDVLFAFNRYVVKVAGETPDRQDTLAVQSGDVRYTDTRTADSDGNCEMVFNHYLQLFFDKDEVVKGNVSLSITVNVNASDKAGYKTYTVYWGAISAGERLGDRTLRYYPALNNPLPAWMIEKTLAMVQADNDEAIDEGTTSSTTLYDLRDFFESVGGIDGKREMVLLQFLSSDSQSTFDETFDYTFWAFGKSDILRTRVIVDCATSGVYLKWIDPQGCWYYYLFEPYTKTMKTKAVGDDYETFTEGENVGYYGALRPQGLTREDTQTIVAPLVSKEERRVLNTILQSPLVFWCPDVEEIASGDLTNETAEWLPVRIVAGSTKDDLTYLADFEITVQYPNPQAQTL